MFDGFFFMEEGRYSEGRGRYGGSCYVRVYLIDWTEDFRDLELLLLLRESFRIYRFSVTCWEEDNIRL